MGWVVGGQGRVSRGRGRDGGGRGRAGGGAGRDRSVRFQIQLDPVVESEIETDQRDEQVMQTVMHAQQQQREEACRDFMVEQSQVRITRITHKLVAAKEKGEVDEYLRGFKNGYEKGVEMMAQKLEQQGRMVGEVLAGIRAMALMLKQTATSENPRLIDYLAGVQAVETIAAAEASARAAATATATVQEHAVHVETPGVQAWFAAADEAATAREAEAAAHTARLEETREEHLNSVPEHVRAMVESVLAAADEAPSSARAGAVASSAAPADGNGVPQSEEEESVQLGWALVASEMDVPDP